MSSNKTEGASTYDFWDGRRGKISSAKGGRISGKDVYCHGHSIMNDLIGNITYMQMVVLNATGRIVDKRLADWFEAHFMGLSWPDPRIWCNTVGALAGTSATSVVAGTVAGVLASDSRIYGGSQTSEPGMLFIRTALERYKQGESVSTIVEACPKREGRPQAMGYVRPVNGKDERIAPIERVTKALGFEVGEHLSLAHKISDYLEENFQEGINIGGYAYAFLADQGVSGEELYRIRSMIVASGVTACYIDTRDKDENAFLPLHCNDIDYLGVADRELS